MTCSKLKEKVKRFEESDDDDKDSYASNADY